MNSVCLTGRLVRDPEVRQAGNTQVASFTIAVDRRFKSANGEREADFISCVAWRNTAEFVSKYFKKGSPIELQGSIQTRTWNDKEGKRHWATEVVADSVGFGAGSSGGNKNNSQGQQQQAAPAQTRSNGVPPPAQPHGYDPGLDQAGGFQGVEEIPFDLDI